VPRATAQSAEDRRRSILDATTSLLRDHGLAVTTKQIADAAGVAEGTIFRYFPTKQDLLQEVVAQMFDPAGVLERFATIDPAAGLPDKLGQIVTVLLASVERMRSLMLVFHDPAARDLLDTPRSVLPPQRFGPVLRGDSEDDSDSTGRSSSGESGPHGDFDPAPRRTVPLVLDALADLLRPDLGSQAETAAAFVHALTMASALPPVTHPSLRDRATLLHLIHGALDALRAWVPAAASETPPVSSADIGSLAEADHSAREGGVVTSPRPDQARPDPPNPCPTIRHVQDLV